MNRPKRFFWKTLASLFAVVALAAQAQEDEETDVDEEDEVTEVEPIRVEAEVIELKPGYTRYSSELIDRTPVGEGNLSDLLQLNPAVDLSRSSDLSAGTASLRPNEISIHGQPFYQNLFLIEGMDATSDLNPASSGDLFAVPSLVNPIGGSSPQAFFIDVSLIDNIEIYDSNIPAKYGGFTGGVIAAELKDYDGENKITWTYTRQKSDWEEFHITEDDVTAADKYRGVYTPDYDKADYGVTVVQGLTEKIGLTLGVSRKTSTFAQEFEDDADVLQMTNYDDALDVVVAKVNTEIGKSKVEFSLTHTIRENDGLTSTAYTGRFTKSHEALGLTAGLEREFGFGTFEMNVSRSGSSDTLDSETNDFTYHEYLENSGVSRFDGAFGDSNQEQVRVNIGPEWNLNPRKIGKREHSFSFGGDYSNTQKFYERPEDVVFEQYFCVRDAGSNGCRDQDGSGDSSAGDEFLQRESTFGAGKVEVDYSQIALYVQDAIDFNRWEAVLGLRGTHDGFLENFNVSPRFKLTWSQFDDPEVRGRGFSFGINRYYGRSFLQYAVNRTKRSWRVFYANLTRPRGRDNEEIPCSHSGFVNCTRTTFEDDSGHLDLDTPYSDEVSIGWKQPFGRWLIDSQFVNRESRKGVSYERRDDGRYYYTNDGESTNQRVSLRLENDIPIRVAGTETTFKLSMSYSNSKSNRQDDSGYDEQIEADLIYYKDKLISFDELPSFDFNIPVKIGLSSHTVIPKLNLEWSNTYHFKKGGTIAIDSREDYTSPDTGLDYDIYEDFDFDSLFTVNSKIEWNPRFSEQIGTFVRVEIHNLFDDFIDTSTSDIRRRNTQGRRFWITVGGTFF